VRGNSKNRQKPRDNQEKRPVPQWIAPTIAAIAAVIALGSLFFTTQTYYVAQRPYVGIFDANVNIETVERDGKKIPVKIAWQFLIKNTGGIPASLTTEKHVCQLKQGERTTPLTGIGPLRNTKLIMPNGIDRLPTNPWSEFGGVKVEDVFTGKAVLTCDTDFSYTPISGLLKWTFVYRVSNRFMPEFEGFVMDSAFAN
jgi:hypothetical protein